MPETAAHFAELNAQLEDEWFERYPSRIDDPAFAELVDETAAALVALERAFGRKVRCTDITIADVSDVTEGDPLFELDLFGARIGFLTTDLPDPNHPWRNDLGWKFTGMGLTRDSVEHDRVLLIRCEEPQPAVWREIQFLLLPATVARAQRDAKSEALARLAIGRNRTRSREKLPV